MSGAIRWSCGPDDLRLIRAALGVDRRPQTYRWVTDRWLAHDLGEAQERLLPLIHVHMTEEQFRADSRLMGVQMSYTVRNAELIRQLKDVTVAFREAGIPGIVLKGCALAPTVYPTLGSRPMTDVDMLVPEDTDGSTIADALAPLGATLRRATMHAWTFDSPHWSGSLDVHRYLSQVTAFPGSTAPLWQTPDTMTVGGEQFTVLRPEHQLVHLICHGVPAVSGAGLRWVVDAALVHRKAVRVDGSEIRGLADSLRLNDTVRQGWDWLLSQGLVSERIDFAGDDPADRAVQKLLQSQRRSAALRFHYVSLPRRLRRISVGHGRDFDRREYYRRTMGVSGPDPLLPVAVRKTRDNLRRMVRSDAELPRTSR